MVQKQRTTGFSFHRRRVYKIFTDFLFLVPLFGYGVNFTYGRSRVFLTSRLRLARSKAWLSWVIVRGRPFKATSTRRCCTTSSSTESGRRSPSRRTPTRPPPARMPSQLRLKAGRTESRPGSSGQVRSIVYQTSSCKGGRHSTEVAFALLTQPSRVRFLCQLVKNRIQSIFFREPAVLNLFGVSALGKDLKKKKKSLFGLDMFTTKIF